MSVKTKTGSNAKNQSGTASPFAHLIPTWTKRIVKAFVPDTLRDAIVEEGSKLPPLPVWDPEKDVVKGSDLPKALRHILARPGLPRNTLMSGKKLVLWCDAVGRISNACFNIAVNRDQAILDWAASESVSQSIATQYVDRLLAEGKRLVEDSADFKDLITPARPEVQELLKNTSWFMYNLTKVKKASPSTAVSVARDRGVTLVNDPVTVDMEETVELFHKKHMEIQTSIGTSSAIPMLYNNARMIFDMETPENPLDWTDIRARIIKDYGDDGIPGAEKYWELANDIKGYQKHRSLLLNKKLFEDAEMYREAFTSRMRQEAENMEQKEVSALVTYSTLGVLCSWLGTEDLAKKYPDVMFGIDLFRRNTTELNAALDVQLYRESLKTLPADYDEETDENIHHIIRHQWELGGIKEDYTLSLRKILEISKSGEFMPDGYDFTIDAASGLFKTLDPVGFFYVTAISNRKIADKDSTEVKWAPIKALRIGGETPLREWWIGEYQYVFGGDDPEEKEKGEVIRPCTTLSGSNVTMAEVPYMDPEGRIEEVKEGDVNTIEWYDEPVSVTWKKPSVKTPKRVKGFMLSARDIYRVGDADMVEIDLPKVDEFEAYSCMNPKTVWKNTFDGVPTEEELDALCGVNVGARGWFTAKGELKSVFRIDKKCPEDVFLYTHGTFKDMELEVTQGSKNILCMYRHKGDHARTNRSLMHREDLMLASINEFKSFLGDNRRIIAEIGKSAERIMGSIPCPVAFTNVAAQTIGNADNVKNCRLPFHKFAYKLYVRPAFKELGEKVKKGHIVCDTKMWEGIVHPETFLDIALQTGGPDLDDAFYVIIYPNGLVEVLRDPQVAGDGFMLSSVEVV